MGLCGIEAKEGYPKDYLEGSNGGEYVAQKSVAWRTDLGPD